MKKSFRLEGLGCANCAAKMETAINKLDGVIEATVNFMTTKLVIEGEEDKMPTILAEAEKIIKKIEPDTIMKKA
jgi:copper chaperone CopZ